MKRASKSDEELSSLSSYFAVELQVGRNTTVWAAASAHDTQLRAHKTISLHRFGPLLSTNVSSDSLYTSWITPISQQYSSPILNTRQYIYREENTFLCCVCNTIRIKEHTSHTQHVLYGNTRALGRLGNTQRRSNESRLLYIVRHLNITRLPFVVCFGVKFLLLLKEKKICTTRNSINYGVGNKWRVDCHFLLKEKKIKTACTK